MKYIDLGLRSDKELIVDILLPERRKNSFYHDVLPSERVEADEGLPFIPIEWVLGIDGSIDKDNIPPKLTLTKNKNKNVFKSKK